MVLARCNFVKIALVVHDYHRQGGHSRYTVELAERFARDHEVHVFANRIEDQGSAKIHFHRVPSIRATALTTILSFPLPATAAIGRGFDIVHAQGLACFGANVVTAHICNRTWYEARLESNDPIRPHERLFASIVNRAERMQYRQNTATEVIAVSSLVAGNLREAYGRSARVSVIYHGVDLERFSPTNRAEYRNALRRELGIPEEALIALWVGDLRKGALTSIDAIAEAQDWHLLLVSRTAPEPYAEHAAQRGVAERVTFAPPTDVVERYYAAADAFVFPSAYDAFGMVVTEAMASGIPVLVSRAAGASELVEDGVSGRALVSSCDGAEPARWLNEWANDRDSLDRMGAAAREAVLPYTWDAIAGQTLAVYERAVGRRRP
jgi:UDP-glucose:(heptosyl)LPS alpha-1,3-glucosyltransferase